MCCVATSFDASEDFAIAKPAGVGCRYLRRDCRCAIHDRLVERGFGGCAIYDCYGAGPRVTRAFAGRPGCDPERDEAFLILRVVHELLWLLTQAARRCSDHVDRHLAHALDLEIDALDAVAHLAPSDLIALDMRPYLDRARAVLHRTGEALGDRQRAARLLAVAAGRG
jgi:hypothetical protein